MNLRILLDPAAEGGGGGDKESPIDMDRLEATLSKLLAEKGGDASKVSIQLLGDNLRLRRANARLRESQPKEGSVAVPAEDAAALAEYRKLGAPDAVAKGLGERAQFASELAAARRQATTTEAASVYDWNPAVLQKLLADEADRLEIKRDAKGNRSVTVKDGDKELDLREYVTSRMNEFLPALEARPEKAGAPLGTPSRAVSHTQPAAPGSVEERAAQELLSRGGYGRM